MKKLIHFNLSSSTDRHAGMGVYSTEIMQRMPASDVLSYEAGFNSLQYEKHRHRFAFDFPVKYSLFPGRLVFSTKYAKYIPLTYNQTVLSRADVFVFWGNRLPSLRVKGKVVAVVHDITPMHLAQEMPHYAAKFAHNLRHVLARADQLITVSQNSRREIAESFGYDINRIKVVPNGVDFDAFNNPITEEERQRIRQKYQLPDRYLLYFGNTRKFKNITNVIRAYSLLPKEIKQVYKLVVANRADYLTELVEKLDLKEQVLILDGVDEADKVGVYQMAAIKLFLSYYEGFGIPVIEAMAAGVPVIAANTSALPEVCGGAASLVDPSDPQAAADAIAAILQNPGLRADLVRRGLANAKRHSWEASAEALANLLEETTN